MNDTNNSHGDYRIEISGWGLDEGFFVERTELKWDATGEKQVQLHHAMGEGAIVFVRLLTFESANSSLPVAYQVQDVLPTDRHGRCIVSLSQLHPRGQVSFPAKAASNGVEDSQAACNAVEASDELQHEEILQ